MTWTERKTKTLETPRRILTFTISCTPFLHVIIKKFPFSLLQWYSSLYWGHLLGIWHRLPLRPLTSATITAIVRQ